MRPFENIRKKLVANDKSLETIHAKMDLEDGSTTNNNQLSFNKILEAQLVAATHSVHLIMAGGWC